MHTDAEAAALPPGAGGLAVPQLEIYSVEGPVCVVRCWSGPVRVGQTFEDGRLTVTAIQRYSRRVETLDTAHSAKVTFSGDAVPRLRHSTAISPTGPRLYGYVGDPAIRAAVRPGTEGRAIRTPGDFAAWASEQTPDDLAEPFTYVIDADGVLRLAPRHSEHVACAARGWVFGAGEIAFTHDGDGWAVTSLTNQSTGYCPDPDSWPPVSAALSLAGLAYTDGFTHAFVFRHCGGCEQLNVVRDGFFVCVFCGADLHHE
ncbi:hypothetical protein AB0A69_24135 [Streptomyces sp. NPDC045431]|uniref:hypothetical protein n=1 Tax=Streptomyces sp. NPDC045431 TaxID=3155613 RepID=UPI0034102037